MLVLSRKVNEKIVIGNNPDISKNVVITIVEIRSDKVRIGIEAPKEVSVHRHEVYKSIQAGKHERRQDALALEQKKAGT